MHVAVGYTDLQWGNLAYVVLDLQPLYETLQSRNVAKIDKS